MFIPVSIYAYKLGLLAFWSWENLTATTLATSRPASPDLKIAEGIKALAFPFRTLIGLFCDVLTVQVVNARTHLAVMGNHKFTRHFKSPLLFSLNSIYV